MLSGKVGGKLADSSGNVVELKYYEVAAEVLSSCETGTYHGHLAPP